MSLCKSLQDQDRRESEKLDVFDRYLLLCAEEMDLECLDSEVSDDNDGDGSDTEGAAAAWDWKPNQFKVITERRPTEQANGPSNPLMIPEVMNQAIGYLNCFNDLLACFEVCKIWRGLVSDHNIRARLTRAPVTVERDFDDPKSITYLAAIGKHPSFRATKFKFLDTNLSSPEVRQVLEENWQEIEQLEIQYNSSGQGNPVALFELLRNGLPALKTLIVTQLPFASGTMWTGANAIPDSDSYYRLQLKRIQISLDLLPPYRYHCLIDYNVRFFTRLFALCPLLEEFAVTLKNRHLSHHCYQLQNLLHALIPLNRLRQIKILEIPCLCDAATWLGSNLAVDQLQVLRVHTIEDRVDNIGIGIANGPLALRDLLRRQCNSLQHLEIPINGSTFVNLPPMPALLEFKICKTLPPPPPAVAAGGVAAPIPVFLWNILNYALKLPNLRVLGFRGPQEHFAMDEIWHDWIQPSLSVQELDGLPLSVDQALMARIGRLFPNLSIVRIMVRYNEEELLQSIWEFYPNICELFLALDDEQGGTEGQERECLDSLFSGIPERDCRRLRELRRQKREILPEFKELGPGALSICNLKKLKRLTIEGFGEISWLKDRQDKLTNICGYSTFASLSPHLELLHVDRGLVKMTSRCIKYICNQLKLEHVKEFTGLRLVRPGVGIELH